MAAVASEESALKGIVAKLDMLEKKIGDLHETSTKSSREFRQVPAQEWAQRPQRYDRPPAQASYDRRGTSGPAPGRPSMRCFRCNSPHHLQRDCPAQPRGYGGQQSRYSGNEQRASFNPRQRQGNGRRP